jgi:hypothetical protein
MSQRASVFTDCSAKRPKLRKIDMRFGTWNVRNFYRARLLRAMAEENSKYKFDLV